MSLCCPGGSNVVQGKAGAGEPQADRFDDALLLVTKTKEKFLEAKSTPSSQYEYENLSCTTLKELRI